MLVDAISKLAATSASENYYFSEMFCLKKMPFILQKSWIASPLSDMISCSSSIQPITLDFDHSNEFAVT